MTDVVVSLTAIRPRLDRLPAVIASIRSQRHPPSRIHLNLSREPFMLDTGIGPEDLPEELRALESAGDLHIEFVPNTGPYRKLLPTLRHYAGQDVLLVTADDDVVYPKDWLGGLVAEAGAARSVVAHNCRAMPVRDGRLLPYRHWIRLAESDATYGDVPPELHGLFTCPIGRNGILYHASFFHDLALLEDLMRVAPSQDDLAFKALMMVQGIGTRMVPPSGGGKVRDLPSEGPKLYSANKAGGNDDAVTGIFGLLESRGLLSIENLLAAAVR
ncbi:hypothetical protein VQH23_24270 [Pararoseomonas sp. SCSIO 73927]|uniref:glycosyltransferase family 2 protein n=1 Tax=Pararoseomonas sp. SCSIO 73927 TaxID=3114537 RepID=UPI0030CF97CC